MTWLNRRRTLVIGAARSGHAAARLLAARGARVQVLEKGPAPAAERDWPEGVAVRYGDDRGAGLEDVSLVVPSPGVPRDHPLLRDAVARRIPVWSEIELAARFLDCPILAITGTNGKSTTTTLLGAMLAADGHRVFVGGNLGTPLSDAAVDERPYAAAVVEVSSFQLEWVEQFRPNVAVLLNLTPDHQDRYLDPAEYGAAKARLLARQESGDIAVLNRDDPWVWEQRRVTRASVISFGRDPVEFGTFLDGGDVVVFGTREPRRYALSDSPLRGDHNRENIQAAVTAATAWGVSSDAIRAALRSTGALPHRLALVRDCRGVSWYDDSKATNVGAVEKSLASFAGGVVLLLGGYDKGGDFSLLRPLVRERAARLVCFGKAGADIARQLDGAAACEVVESLAAAVAAAARAAVAGQSVVLAPGCASFDEFTDFADRGRRFRAEVEKL
jgi:UDP-N-acetylmuramoylalanine--D-glutamate ligase